MRRSVLQKPAENRALPTAQVLSSITPTFARAALRDKLPALNVVGGCCGTDQRHVTEICSALISS
jgi:methionine synthase I (cobalamin-dependent)